MEKNLLDFPVKPEKERIVSFLHNTFLENRSKGAVIGLSGGIDSATAFYLLTEALDPQEIYVMHLYYFNPVESLLLPVLKEKKIPEKNIYYLSIRGIVEEIANTLKISLNKENQLRIGNIAARVRMTFLFDLAKKTGSLVCGTENKSENMLGYFTRFGDQASDIEPIAHLYKTQVYDLAKCLKVSEEIIKQIPSAGLWKGQTDEDDFGFTYKEADEVLNLYFDRNEPIEKIEAKGYKNAKLILRQVERNAYKQKVPYHL